MRCQMGACLQVQGFMDAGAENTMFRWGFNKAYFTAAILLFVLEVVIAQTSGFIRHTVGDYFVVMLMYATLRAFVRLSTGIACLAVLLLAYAVELLQLTDFLAFFGLEESYVANIIFGNTFSMTDLAAYTLGIVTVFCAELVMNKLAK